jgi:hypothetical protein
MTGIMEYHTKTCKICNAPKKFVKEAGQNKKASGFMGRVCWECATQDNTLRNRVRYGIKIEECRKYYKNIKMRKRKNDPITALADLIRTRLSAAFRGKGWTKRSKTQVYLGASFIEVKQHLEKQFTEGMTWENRGKWHIDHIKPLIKAKTVDELITRAHYTNLQPLWAIDNLRKGCKDV